MSRCLLLDLYCKAGGASQGYYDAGFDVVGVDIEPQPNYPFEFIQADALEYLAQYGFIYDVIAASPPCQRNSRLKALTTARNGDYPKSSEIDLIAPTRELCIKLGKPYVIENVVGAPLINPVMYCGSMFPELRVYRHRLFESNVPIVAPIHYPHRDTTPSAGNGVSPKGFISVCGTGGVKGMTSTEIVEYWSMAMGIDWMNRKELSQAIPPAFTEHIGLQIAKYYEWDKI